MHERQAAQRKKEPGVTTLPTSYRAFIDYDDLHIFLTAQRVKAAGVQCTTEKQLGHWIRFWTAGYVVEDQLFLFDQAVKFVKMNMSLFKAEEYVLALLCQYLMVLESAGFSGVMEKKLNIVVDHVLKPLKPTDLRDRTNDIIMRLKDENLDHKCFVTFRRELIKQATSLEGTMVFHGFWGPKINKDSFSEGVYIIADPKNFKGRKEHWNRFEMDTNNFTDKNPC